MRIGVLILLLVVSLPGRAQWLSPGETLGDCLWVLRDKDAAPLDTFFAIWRLGQIGNFAHEAAPELIARLGDPRFSDAAADTIHRLGAGKTLVFLDALKSASSDVRQIAARELLVTNVELDDIEDRRAFVEMIVNFNTDRTVRLLAGGAADPDPEIREMAISALARSRDKELRWVTNRIIESNDTDAGNAYGNYPDELATDLSVSAVRAWLSRQNLMLERAPTREELATLEAARQREMLERQEALRRLLVEQAWIELLSGAPQVRDKAATVIDEIWIIARQTPDRVVSAVSAKIMAMEKGTVTSRRQALTKLAKMPVLAGPAYSAVLRRLHDDDAIVRRRAAQLLGTEEARRIALHGDLVDRLQSEQPEIRAAAIEALISEQLVDSDTAKVLQPAVESNEWIMRTGFVLAAHHAWRDGKTIPATLDDLEARMGDPIDKLAVAAARRMLAARTTSREVIAPQRTLLLETLRRQMSTTDPAAMRHALRAAQQTGLAQALVREVESYALHTDRQVLGDASVVLLSLGEAGVPGLVSMLENGDEGARQLALLQLGTLGTTAAAATKPVRKACDDSDRQIAQMASNTLRRLDPFRPDPIRQAELSPWVTLLKDPLPANRQEAARRLYKEGVLEKAVSEALLKAVMAGDFAAREGLVMGIERAWKLEISVESTLRTIAAEEDSTRRALANSGLRAIAAQSKRTSPLMD